MRKHLSKVYIGLIISLGVAAACYSMYRIHMEQQGYEWLILVILTILIGSRHTVRLPRVKSKMALSDTFIFASILLYGPYPATITAGIDAYFSSKKTAGKNVKMAFHMGTMAFTTFLTGSLIQYYFGNMNQFAGTHAHLTLLLILLAIMACIQFFGHSAIIAWANALERGRNLFSFRASNRFWTCMTYFSGSAAAGIAFLLIHKIGYFAFFFAVPVLFITYFTYKTYLDKVETSDKHMKKLTSVYLSTVEALAMAIDAKDVFTHGHVRRVQVYTLALARAGKYFGEAELEGLRTAALLHDIGKLAIPEYVLNKPGRLSEIEFSKLTCHPSIGVQILSNVDFPYPVHAIVRHHHERYDGTGYPDRLSGSEIPLGSRILSIADCFEALTADRPYRPAFSKEKAIEIMLEDSGKGFDAEILEVFLSIVHDVHAKVLALEFPALKLEEFDEKNRGAYKENKKEAAKQISDGRQKYADITDAVREVLAIYEISQSLGSTLHLSELLTVISSKIKRIADFDTCVVYLYDKHKSMIHAAYTAGEHMDLFRDRHLEPGRGITGWAVANRQKVVNDSPLLDLGGMDKEVAASYTNALVLPLLTDDQILGALSLYTRGAVYGPDQVRFLETVAGHASKAIHNSLVFERTQEHAVTDNLTGLHNFRYFYAFFNEEIQKASQRGGKLSFLFMDLDHFKLINDKYGHKVGDEMLKNIAMVLSSQMRENDMLVRYGGDEFIALLSDITEEAAGQTIKRLEDAIGEYNFILRTGEPVNLGISIGHAFFPEDGKTIEDLLVKADKDMYRKKALKKKRGKTLKQDNLIRYPGTRHAVSGGDNRES